MDRLQTYIKWLADDPVSFLTYAAYFTVVVLLSLILHECAHGYAALMCGDETAKKCGRLSLNPAHHLSLMGTVCMVVLGVGWAKPVPVNPANYKNRRKGDFLVSIAGISVNLALFLISALCSTIIAKIMWNKDFLLEYANHFGSVQGLVNPFAKSGSDWANSIIMGMSYDIMETGADVPWLLWFQRFFLMLGQINLSLALFNLLPVPPLDGYHLLFDVILSDRFHIRLSGKAFYIAQAVLLLLCITGVLGSILSVMVSNVYTAFMKVILLLFGLK